jgi:hypothetical protein
MSYDPQGNVDALGNPTWASVDSLGIYGATNGALVFDFATPATQFSFDFRIATVFAPTPYGAIAIFNNVPGDVVTAQGNFVPDTPSDPSLGGSSYGTLSFSGEAFNQAVIYLSTDGDFFTAGNITYTPTPEPATMALVGLGALGSTVLRRRRLR